MNFNNVFYLIRYIQKVVISTSHNYEETDEIFYILVLCRVFKSVCIFHVTACLRQDQPYRKCSTATRGWRLLYWTGRLGTVPQLQWRLWSRPASLRSHPVIILPPFLVSPFCSLSHFFFQKTNFKNVIIDTYYSCHKNYIILYC